MDFTDLENDDEYKGLSYEKQLRIKARITDETLAKNEPEYTLLNPEKKQSVISQIIDSPPVFKDFNMNQKVKGIQAQLSSSNEQERKNAENFIKVSYQQEKGRDSSVISSLIGAVTDPLTNTLDKFIFDKEDEFLTVEEGHRHPENAKLREWVEKTIKSDERFKKDLLAINVFNTVQAGVEIVGMYGKFAGSTFNPKGLAKPVIDFISAGVKGSKHEIVRSLLTASKPIAHAGVTTLMGAARDITIENLNKGAQEDYKVQETLLQVSDKLPSYMVFDILANAVLDVALPMGWATRKILTGGFAGKATLKEASSAALEHVLTGKGLSQTLVDRVPEAAKHLESVRVKLNALKNLDVTKPKDIAWAVGESLGYRAREIEGGIEFTQIGQNKVSFSGSVEKGMKFLKAQINESSDVLLKDKNLIGAKGEHFIVRNIMERTLSPDHAGSAPVLSNLLAPVAGRYNKSKLTGFVRTFLKSQDAESLTIKSVVVRESGGTGVSLGEGKRVIGKTGGEEIFNAGKRFDIEINGKKVFSLPESISTPEMERDIAEKLTKELQIFSRGSKDISGTFIEGYKEQVKAQKLFSPEWLEQAVKGLDEFGAGAKVKVLIDGQVEVVGASGKQTFKNFEEAVSVLNKKTLSMEELNSYLKHNFNLTLKQTEGHLSLVNDGRGIVVDTFEGIEDFYARNSFMTPKLSSKLAPDIFVLDDGAVKIKYIQKAAVGQYQHILKELDGYLGKVKAWKEIDLSVGGVKRKIQFSDSPAVKSVDVFYPEVNHVESFRTLKEARASLTKNFEEFDDLHKLAGAKGFYLNTVGTRYYLIDSTGKTVVYDSVDAVKKTLKTIPTSPEFAPELSSVSPELVQGIVGNFNLDPIKYVNPKYLKEGTLTTDGLVNEMFSNTYLLKFTTMEGYLRKAISRGENIEIQKLFYKVRDTRNIIHVEDVDTANYIHELFKVNGKKIPQKVKENMMRFMEETDLARKQDFGKDLTPAHLDIIEKVRTFYGADRGRGAFLKYAQDFVDFKVKYAPQIRNWVDKTEKRKLLKDGMSPKEMLNDVFENKEVAGKIGAFFRHSRIQDILDVARDMDIESAMLKYAKIGNRALYLAPVWDEAAKLLKDGDNISLATKMRFLMYQGEIMGTFKLPYEKIAETSLNKFYDNIQSVDFKKRDWRKQLNPKEVEAKTRSVQRWMYMNLMGFKPMLALRNAFQPYATTASYLGTEYVARAEKALINDLTGSYYKQLKSEGLIRGEIPLFEEEMLNAKVMNGYYRMGLKWFENSEDYVRAVTAKTSELRFNDAWDEYVKSGGKMGDKEFLKKSGMQWLEASRQMQAMEMLNKGKIRDAKALFASDMVDKGAFRYQSGETIPFFTNHGAIGKLFGKFGTYSVQYIAQINSVLSKASIEDKLLFGTRLVGNTVAINEALGMVGVNGSSLLWYSPFGFAGGPVFDFMLTGMQSTSSSFEGKMARGKLKTEGEGLLFPGWARNVYKATESGMNGDYYKGFLQLMGAGIEEDFFED